MDKRLTLLFVLLLAAGAFFRLYPADCSFGVDAQASIKEATRLSAESFASYLTLENLWNFQAANVPRLAHHLELTMPGFYLILKSLQWFGVESDSSLRMLSAASFSIALIPIMLCIGIRVRGVHSGIILVLLTVLSPLLQYYGTYIRFYAAMVFFAGLGYFHLVQSAIRLARGEDLSKTELACLAILFWLPLWINISSLLIVAIYTWILLFFIIPKLERKSGQMLLAAVGVLGIIPLGNSVAHLLARFTDSGAVDNVMSQSALSFIGSLYFNFNGGIFLVILIALVFCQIPRQRFLLLYCPYLIAMGALFIAAILRNDLFRPDYVSSLLPVTYLLFSESIVELSTAPSIKQIGLETQSRVLQYCLTAVVLLASLPSFVSNAFIDQDRFDYKRAIEAIKKHSEPNDLILVYAVGQDRFLKYDFDSDRIQLANLHQYGTLDHSAFNKVFIALGWRREGFSKDFATVTRKNKKELPRILNNSTLLEITGRSRLDLRDNLLFIFEEQASLRQ